MAGKNTVVKEIAIKNIFPDIKPLVDSTISFNQGDLLYLDTTNHLIKVQSAEGDAATLLGIATIDVVSGKPRSPYTTSVDASVAVPALNGPIYGMTAKMILKTGDSLNAGDVVYSLPASGARYVQSSGTKIIGVYQGAAVASAAAGTEVEVLIGSRYPSDTLRF